MNPYRVIAIFICAFCISSCSIPITVSLYNNSSDKISVSIDSENYTISKGSSEEIIDFAFYNVSITRNGKVYMYRAPEIDYKYVEWVGWGPFTKRVFFAQLEPNGEIWATDRWQPRPARAFKNQPEGFPLKPGA